MVKCSKCSGTGHLNYHTNYANGVCFACNGTGKVKKDNSGVTPWNKILHLHIDMEESKKYSKKELDANIEWAIRKHKSETPASEILDAFRESLTKRGVKASW